MTTFIKENLVGSLLASFIVGAIISYGVLQNHETRISRLEKDQMAKALIELSLNNINLKLDAILTKSGDTEKALNEHILETKYTNQ